MSREPWQQWQDQPEIEGTLVKRARGELGEMESTKQLVRLVEAVYEPGMRALDVGCNSGHYLRGLRRIAADLDYTGVDAYDSYIAQARSVFGDDSHARFEVRDVFQPLFPDDPFDIVFCCNVLLHLPDFRRPIENLLAATKRVCFVRTLLGANTTIVRRAMTTELTPSGDPADFVFQNTWAVDLFVGHAERLGWKTEVIDDEFDPSVLEQENESLKGGGGTRILGGKQIDGNIVFEWRWVKLTPAS